MTTKDYVKFATAIKEEMNKVPDEKADKITYNFYDGQRVGIESMARRLAEICQQDNENFNIEQFLHVAGIK